MISYGFDRSTVSLLCDRHVSLAFWILGITTVLNLNGLVRMGFGIEQVFTLALLLTALACILLSRFPPSRCLGAAGLVLVLFLSCYVLISFLAGYVRWADLRTPSITYVISYMGSLLLIVATAVGTYTVLRSSDADSLLAKLERLLLIAVLAIVFSPLLRAAYVLPTDTAAFRFAGTFGNPNSAGSLGCVAAALSLTLLGAGRGTRISWLCFSIAVLATVLTFSRTSIITLVVLIAVQFLVASNRSFKVKLATWAGISVASVLGLALLGALAAVLTVPQQLDRLVGIARLVAGGDLGSAGLSERLIVWHLAVGMIHDSPVIGNGMGTLHQIADAPFNASNERLGAHNQYLTVWGEGGIISIMLFMMALTIIAWDAIRLRESVIGRFVLAYLFVFILSCMTSHNELTLRFQDFLLGFSCGALAYEHWLRRDAVLA